MSRIRSSMRQSPAIVIALIALTFSLGGGAGYAASVSAAKAPAATKITWHALSLRSGWHAAAKGYGAANPQYTVSNGIVYLDGAVSRTSQALPALIGVLPRGSRPSHWLTFEGENYAASGETDIQIAPNGDVYVNGSGGDEYYFQSLDGIQFPLGA
jgi:hypothetical protein